MIKFLALLLTPALLYSQGSGSLTLEEAQRMALENNPTVVAARIAVEQAQARVRQSKAAFYPQVGFSGLGKAGLSGSMNGLQPVGIANSPFFRNFATGVNVGHPGLDFGRTRHSVAVERAQMQALDEDVKRVEADVLLGVERSFLQALQASAMLDAATQIVAGREQIVRQARAFYEGELRSKVDLGLAQTQLAEAQIGVIEAEQLRGVAEATLAHSVGVHPREIGTLSEPADRPDLEDDVESLVRSAYEARPEISTLAARQAAASAAVQLARAQRKPWFSMFFTGGWARFTALTLSNLTAVGVGLASPLFSFGRLEGAIEEAAAQLSQLDQRLEEARQLIALDVRIAHRRATAAARIVPLRAQQAEVASDVARLARARYREQLGSMAELAQAEAALANVRSAEVAARYDLLIARAELRWAVGGHSAAAH